MAERLSEIEARIGSVRQLSAVIGAMRGIAAVRLREAETRLEGIRAHARTVAEAIGETLALAPAAAGPPRGEDGHLVIALCGEHGFTGRHDEALLDRAMAQVRSDKDLLLVGDHALAKAQDRGISPWHSLPMAAHADEIPALATRVGDLLYARLLDGDTRSVSIVHARPGHSAETRIADRNLLPFDFGRFAPSGSRQPPLFNLPPARLLTRLSEEYVFAELCEALMLSYAAENEARMRAMIAARGNVEQRLDTLTADARRLRQETITSEITELAASSQQV